MCVIKWLVLTLSYTRHYRDVVAAIVSLDVAILSILNRPDNSGVIQSNVKAIPPSCLLRLLAFTHS